MFQTSVTSTVEPRVSGQARIGAVGWKFDLFFYLKMDPVYRGGMRCSGHSARDFFSYVTYLLCLRT